MKINNWFEIFVALIIALAITLLYQSNKVTYLENLNKQNVELIESLYYTIDEMQEEQC